MKINEAIEKAIEGGYEVELTTVAEKAKGFPHNIEKILLDPTFWSCLGKAMGWEILKECPCCHKVEEYCRCDNSTHWTGSTAHWHSLIDHLANKGTVEEWFGKLK